MRADGLDAGLWRFQALNDLTNVLDGTNLEYTYADGGALQVGFHEGLIDYRWLSGPFEGATVTDLPYQARTIADGIYLVSFHVTSEKNFGTLVINVADKTVLSSALVSYKSDEPVTLFDVATITKISRQDA